MGGLVRRVVPRPAVREWCEKHGFSPDLVARWTEWLPDPKPLLASFLKPVPRYLRLNPLRGDADSLEASLTARGFGLERVGSPDPAIPAWRIVKEPFAVSSTPEHLDGRFYLQDLASLTAPAALGARPGERILDMAAAPGGKTTAISGTTGDAAHVLAVEPVPHRAAALTSNLRRLGVRGVGVVTARGEDIEGEALFDRILLDAPCTGEGVLPRDRMRRTGTLEEHETLVRLQRVLLDAAVRLLKPGGVLVYSTCTFAPEECEEAVLHAVGRGLVTEPLPFDALGGVPLSPALEGVGEERFDDAVRHARRAYPNKHQVLGFFVARLRKPEDWDPSLLPKKAPPPVDATAIDLFSSEDEGPVTADEVETEEIPLPPGSSPEATLRGADPPETEAFDTAVAAYGEGVRAHLEADGILKTLERKDITPHRRLIWTRRDDVAALAPFAPIALGITLATLSRKGARLTLEGARAIAPHARRGTVRVDAKGEQLFLYGRHLLVRSLTHWDRPLEPGADVLVLSADGRFLGQGRVELPLHNRRPDIKELAVTNLADLGLYLRAQQKVPE